MSQVTGPVWAAPCPSREGARTAGRPHRGARPAPPSPQAGTRPPARAPSVAVRGKPTVRTDRPGGPDAVRYASVDTAMHRLTVTHRDTRRDKKETARLAENSQLAGRFRRWWQVLGSNQRRLSGRFYRPLLRATLHTYLPAQTSPDWFRHSDAVRYLRQVRLGQAHRQLQAADPAAGATVAAIARRWG